MNAIKRFGSAMVVPVLLFAFLVLLLASRLYVRIQRLWGNGWRRYDVVQGLVTD